MNIEVTWTLNLPFDLVCTNKFYGKELTHYEYEIDDAKIKLIKKENSDIVNRVILSMNNEFNDNFSPSSENVEYLIEFSNESTLKAGIIAQRFFDGISKATKNDEMKIFDGDDFCVEYRMDMSNGLMGGSYKPRRQKYSIDDSKMDKAIQFFKRENNYLDNAWYLLREVSVAYELGKYELCFLNMAIMLELLVTAKLDEFLNKDGRFKLDYKESLITQYGKCPTFVEKYFKYGLSLVSNTTLNEELLEAIDIIYKIRDKVAHGMALFKIPLLSFLNVDKSNIKNFIWQLYNASIEIYNFFYDLEYS